LGFEKNIFIKSRDPSASSSAQLVGLVYMKLGMVDLL